MCIADKDRYEMCIKYANVMMFVAKIYQDKDSDTFKFYIDKGMKACIMAIEYRELWEIDKTSIFKMVA